MAGAVARSRVRAFSAVLAVALLGAGAGATVRAEARPGPGPFLDLHSAAAMAPDGRSLRVDLVASCPERWTVVEGVVSVTQGQASGRGSFSFPCIGSLRPFSVAVTATSGTFELGEALATASLTIRRGGKTERIHDSQSVDVQPTVFVALADTARLESAGGAVTIDVNVACPVGATGAGSYVNVSQGQTASGNGTYVPICDGQEHTFSVRVEASQGVFRPGDGRALTFANVEHDGIGTAGVDDKPVQIVG